MYYAILIAVVIMNAPFNYTMSPTVVVNNPVVLPSPTAVDYITENTKPHRTVCTQRVFGIFLIVTGIIVGGVMTMIIALYVRTC
jgi:hypothetical protein